MNELGRGRGVTTPLQEMRTDDARVGEILVCIGRQCK